MIQPAPQHVFLSCGEASGARYGAALVHELKNLRPGLRISCLGAETLREAGAEVVLDSEKLAVMGFSEVLGALPQILRARRRLFDWIASENVDLVVPVDFPGFNGGLADRARKAGIPVFWLIAPQLWAWGGWRVGRMRRRIDRLGAILPFEREFFSERGFDVFEMGHPLMDDYGGAFPFEEGIVRRERKFQDPDAPLTVALLPGSRRQELKQLLPVLKVTAQTLRGHLCDREMRFLVSAAPGVDVDSIAAIFDQDAEITREPLARVLAASDLALVCSGTASLEAALAGVPHEIVYRTGKFNYWIARRLVKTRFIGLANLILDRPVIREHIQGQAAPLPLARSVLRWISRAEEREGFYADARELRARCGERGVWGRTARAVLDFLDGRSDVPA